jgi:hypothetical protein
MRQESFLFNKQWCNMHYPEKPNGFAIFIIGDQQHFVQEETSYWTQNADREAMIHNLTNAGYLVYYSNLYGNHWGNAASVQLARGLYHLIMKKAILNEKIHILAEGMGALTAIKLLPFLQDRLRSIVLLNPCISLRAHIEQEKNRIFFYKKLLKEIQTAYGECGMDLVIDNYYEDSSRILADMEVPLYILQIIDRNMYTKQKEILEKIYEKRKTEHLPVMCHYLLFENRLGIPRKMAAFFHEYEKQL